MGRLSANSPGLAPPRFSQSLAVIDLEWATRSAAAANAPPVSCPVDPSCGSGPWLIF